MSHRAQDRVKDLWRSMIDWRRLLLGRNDDLSENEARRTAQGLADDKTVVPIALLKCKSRGTNPAKFSRSITILLDV